MPRFLYLVEGPAGAKLRRHLAAAPRAAPHLRTACVTTQAYRRTTKLRERPCNISKTYGHVSVLPAALNASSQEAVPALDGVARSRLLYSNINSATQRTSTSIQPRPFTHHPGAPRSALYQRALQLPYWRVLSALKHNSHGYRTSLNLSFFTLWASRRCYHRLFRGCTQLIAGLTSHPLPRRTAPPAPRQQGNVA